MGDNRKSRCARPLPRGDGATGKGESPNPSNDVVNSVAATSGYQGRRPVSKVSGEGPCGAVCRPHADFVGLRGK